MKQLKTNFLTMWEDEFFEWEGYGNKQFDPYILQLPRIVYAGLWDDNCLYDIAKRCFDENKIFVFITTAKMNTEYPLMLKKCLAYLEDHMWIYETRGMVTRVVLESRARKYVEHYKNSELYHA